VSQGGQMRRLSSVFPLMTIALFLFAMGNAAKADGTDPQVGLGGTGSSGSFTQTQCLVSGDGFCTLALDSTGSGIADILNNTGFNIVSDTINIDSIFGGTLTCNPSNPFGFSVTGGSPGTSCTYFIDPVAGIPGGITYGIHFTDFCMDATCGTPLKSLTFDLVWTNGTTPTPTPEPSAFILLGTGAVALLATGKKLKRAALV
jgi:hypothetical protein